MARRQSIFAVISCKPPSLGGHVRARLLAAALTIGMVSTAGFTTAVSADESVVFDQEWSTTRGAPIADSTAGQVVADNFVLLEDTLVTSLSWFGGYPDPAVPSFGGIPPGETVPFIILFLADDAGQPAWPVPIPEPVMVSFEDKGLLAGGLGGLRLFEFQVTLPEPILVHAEETVWLALIESFGGTNFFWLGSEGIDDVHCYRTVSTNAWTCEPTSDMNFKLFGTLLDADTDSDGVPDDTDVCPDTQLPEAVPTSGRFLLPNRFAIIDQGPEFSTGRTRPNAETFTIFDTDGCSCEQIIDLMGLGAGHSRYGCSLGAMRTFINQLPE